MRIIDNDVMTCKTCDTTFEYSKDELMVVPTHPCMTFVMCPNCGQQIIFVASDFEPVKERIIAEEENGEEKKETE
jgi:RNase P subunit RPR2